MRTDDTTRQNTTHATARFRPFVVLLAVVCAGIVADRHAHLALASWGAAALLSLAAWCMAWRLRWQATSLICLLTSVAVTAGAWHHLKWSIVAHDDLAAFAHDEQMPVCIEVVASDSPRRLPAAAFDPMRAIPAFDRSRLEVRAVRLRDGRRWKPVTGDVTLLVEGHLLGVHSGDRLRVFARLSRPSAPLNPGQFDRAAHARTAGLRSLLAAGFPECVSVVEPAGGWSVSRGLDYLRTQGNALVWRHVSMARSPLAAALLLGQREQLEQERTEAFFLTGTIHLLVISGLHVGILAAGLFAVLRMGVMPRNAALLMVAAVTLLYAMVTDGNPPVLRATVLVLTVCAAIYFGRRPTSFNALAAAGLVVLAWNPTDLFRPGAQLSFLAAGTIAWFAARWGQRRRPDPLAQLIARSRPWPVRGARRVAAWWIRMTLVSAAIWLAALPLVMAHFHLVSPAAIVLSPLLWIPVALALLSGFALLLCGALAPPLADACGACCDFNLHLLETAVSFARDVPGSHFWAPGPGDWWLAVFYAGLAALVTFPRLRPPPRWCAALLAVWITVGMVPGWARSLGPGRLECGFVSVGHGTAVVCRLPDGRTMLYDAGQLGSPSGAARTISEYLWSRGITHLDAVVISHADVDHYCAVPELLQRFSVGVVYVSPVMFERRTAALVALDDAIRKADVPLETLYAGRQLSAGGNCRIEVIHPTRRGVIGSDNANSIVLAIEHAGRRILLPGDLETPGLEQVLAEQPWHCDVLMAPHHGSRSSNPPGTVPL